SKGSPRSLGRPTCSPPWTPTGGRWSPPRERNWPVADWRASAFPHPVFWSRPTTSPWANPIPRVTARQRNALGSILLPASCSRTPRWACSRPEPVERHRRSSATTSAPRPRVCFECRTYGPSVSEPSVTRGRRTLSSHIELGGSSIPSRKAVPCPGPNVSRARCGGASDDCEAREAHEAHEAEGMCASIVATASSRTSVKNRMRVTHSSSRSKKPTATGESNRRRVVVQGPVHPVFDQFVSLGQAVRVHAGFEVFVQATKDAHIRTPLL